MTARSATNRSALFKWLLLTLLALAVWSCGENRKEKTQTETTTDFYFQEISLQANIADTSASYALAATDWDLDGDIDLAISHHRNVSLRENNGDGTFANPVYPGGNKGRDSHGVSFVDINNDGLPDLAFSVGADGGHGSGPKEFYKNTGKGFEQIAPDEVLTDTFGRGRSIMPCDINRDGWQDVMMLNFGVDKNPHRIGLAQNPSGGSFTDIADELGLATIVGGGAMIIDLFNDGKDYLLVRRGGQNTGAVYKKENDAFVEVTNALQLEKGGEAFSAVPFDYDNDGDMDLLHVAGKHQSTGAKLQGNRLSFRYGPLRNPRKVGFRFKPSEGSITLEERFDGRPTQNLYLGKDRIKADKVPFTLAVDDERLEGNPNISIEAGDSGAFLWRKNNGELSYLFIGGDGNLNSVVGFIDITEGTVDTIFHNGGSRENTKPAHRLFRNDGDTFVEVTETAGLRGTGWGHNAVTEDFNNDGFIDVFIVNGAEFSTNVPDQLFLNNGDGTFRDVSGVAGIQGAKTGNGDCAIAFDYDNDGDLDIVTANGFGPWPTKFGPFNLFQNNITNLGNFLQLDLKGTISNKQAWGTRVTVEVNGKTTYFQKTALNGNFSASDLPLHIGLGKATIADEIKIWWPSGIETTLNNVEHGQTLKIVEPD